ncbi:hypothetical protein [Raoultella planticola]
MQCAECPFPQILVRRWAKPGLALRLADGGVCLLAMAIERFAYRRLRNAPRLAPLISGIGVSVLLQTVAMIVWSRNPLMFPQILPMDPIAVTHGSERIPRLSLPSPVSSPSRWPSR